MTRSQRLKALKQFYEGLLDKDLSPKEREVLNKEIDAINALLKNREGFSLSEEQEAEYERHFEELLDEMKALNTNLAIDARGDVWAFGSWYDKIPHFAKGFGHWSEIALDDWMLPNRVPFKPYVHPDKPTKEEQEWTKFYLSKPKKEP